MWTREALKTRAKAMLKASYWKAFLVSLVVAFFGGLDGGMVIRIFLGYQLEVGGKRFFIQAAQGDVNVGYLGSRFEQGYLDILKTMLLRDVRLFFWYLLLIIPGIIKNYAYRMVPYILADNPKIGVKRSIELSEELTDGHKWNMFVLDLSFLGWYILGALACCIGVIFVFPYQLATNAELYLVLRQAGIDLGKCSNEELLLNPSEQPL